jgi:hypothetical protein
MVRKQGRWELFIRNCNIMCGNSVAAAMEKNFVCLKISLTNEIHEIS